MFLKTPFFNKKAMRYFSLKNQFPKKSLLFISTVSLKVNKALYLLVLAGTLRVFALFLKKRQLYLHECRDLTT